MLSALSNVFDVVLTVEVVATGVAVVGGKMLTVVTPVAALATAAAVALVCVTVGVIVGVVWFPVVVTCVAGRLTTTDERVFSASKFAVALAVAAAVIAAAVAAVTVAMPVSTVAMFATT